MRADPIETKPRRWNVAVTDDDVRGEEVLGGEYHWAMESLGKSYGKKLGVSHLAAAGGVIPVLPLSYHDNAAK